MKSIFLYLMLGTFVLTGVFPNSLNATAALFMVLSFASACSEVTRSRSLARLMAIYLAGLAVTFIYLGVGMINGAPAVAAIQVIVTYVCSPLIWIIILTVLFQRISGEKLIEWMVVLSFVGVASVAIFFYLFLNFGVDAVIFFIEDPNINLKDGYSAATMHIYGSFIFLTGAFFATPNLVSGVVRRYFLLGSFVLVAITSGRSALIISIFIGSIIGMMFLPKIDVDAGSRRSIEKPFYSLIKKLFILGGIGFVLVLVTDIDVNVIAGDFVAKLLSGGGVERIEQADALLASVKDNLGLGVGHGVGVSYIRNNEYPWRYELVWFATLHRVGLIGSIVYVLPFVACIAIFLNLWRHRLLVGIDVFMFAGLVSALVASNTNPYIEAFSFQWMYILPVVYFLVVKNEVTEMRSRLSVGSHA